MSKQTELKDKYWVEFLKWYKQTDNIMVDYSTDDLFWYWLVKVKADKSGSDDFMEQL